MSKELEKLMMNYIENLTFEDLMALSRRYNFSLSEAEGRKIISYLNNVPFDPFSENGRRKMIVDLSSITNHDTAHKASSLFNQLVNSYGLNHLFYD